MLMIYKCKYCNFCFSFKEENIKKHIDRQHKDKKV